MKQAVILSIIFCLAFTAWQYSTVNIPVYFYGNKSEEAKLTIQGSTEKKDIQTSRLINTFSKANLSKIVADSFHGKTQDVTDSLIFDHGAIVRGNIKENKIALVFTGDEFADGGEQIATVLKEGKIKASFFFTGRFYRNPSFQNIIWKLKKDGHYLGAHSNEHLLYCDWNNRDSLLVTREYFKRDLLANYDAMQDFGIKKSSAAFFLPPYEWYNDSIAAWTKELGFQLINYTPGTRSTADYTTPEMKNYRSSEDILQSIWQYEQNNSRGLNGFILLVHIGTDSKRTDKLYSRLPGLVSRLKQQGYKLCRVDELLNKPCFYAKAPKKVKTVKP